MKSLITSTRKRSLPVLYALFTVFFMGIETISNAQPFGPACLNTKIDLSTGVNQAIPAVYPYPATPFTQDQWWQVTMLPTGGFSSTMSTPYCAYLPDLAVYNSWWTAETLPGSHWISFWHDPTVATLGAGSGMFWDYNYTFPCNPISSRPARFSRKFWIDGTTPQTVTLNYNQYADDIAFMAFDAPPSTSIYSLGATAPNVIYYQPCTSTTTSPTGPQVFTITLTPGQHELDVDLYDISGDISGINVSATLSCANPVLANNTCFGENICNNTPYGKSCNDSCYWKLVGNTILGGHNVFGTTSNDDVAIRTNGLSRGIMAKGGDFGWNTLVPTAFLHVDCQGGNPDDGSLGSDVRFEHLEPGNGNILVIDANGYVYDSKVPVTPGGGSPVTKALEQQKAATEALQNQVNALQAKLDALTKTTTSGTKTDGTLGNADALYQNVPNPFSNSTTISYFINSDITSGAIRITDVQGNIIKDYAITTKGQGSVVFESYSSTSYYYSLIINGRVVDTKKMVSIQQK